MVAQPATATAAPAAPAFRNCLRSILISPPLPRLPGEEIGEGGDLVVAITLRDLVHDRGRALALLERAHDLHQLVPGTPGEARHGRIGHRLAGGAVAGGAIRRHGAHALFGKVRGRERGRGRSRLLRGGARGAEERAGDSRGDARIHGLGLPVGLHLREYRKPAYVPSLRGYKWKRPRG